MPRKYFKHQMLIILVIIFGHNFVNTQAVLQKVVTLIRHGARTPTDFFNATDWEGYTSGDLTLQGAQQEVALGKWTSELYADQLLGLFKDSTSGLCIKENLSAIFSCKERTILSGLNFLKGLCHQNYLEILPYIIDNYLITEIQNLTDKQNLQQFRNYDELFELDLHLNSCKQVDQFYFEAHNVDFCPATMIEYTNIWTSENFQQRFQAFKNTSNYQNLVKQLTISSNDESSDIYDLILLKNTWSVHQCYVFHGKKSPYNFTGKQLKLLYTIAEFAYYDLENGSQKSRSIQGSWILQSLKNQAEDLLFEHKRKLFEVGDQEQLPSNIVTPETWEDAKEQIDSVQSSNESVNGDLIPINEFIKEIPILLDSNNSLNSNASSTPDTQQNPIIQDSNNVSNSSTSILPQTQEKQIQQDSNNGTESGTSTAYQEADHIPRLILKGLTLLSGHDTTIMNILMLLLSEEDLQLINKLANFSSQLTFEYWAQENGDIDIIIRYNQKKIAGLTQCQLREGYTCGGQDFIELIEPLIIRNIAEECQKL